MDDEKSAGISKLTPRIDIDLFAISFGFSREIAMDRDPDSGSSFCSFSPGIMVLPIASARFSMVLRVLLDILSASFPN